KQPQGDACIARPVRADSANSPESTNGPPASPESAADLTNPTVAKRNEKATAGVAALPRPATTADSAAVQAISSSQSQGRQGGETGATDTPLQTFEQIIAELVEGPTKPEES